MEEPILDMETNKSELKLAKSLQNKFDGYSEFEIKEGEPICVNNQVIRYDLVIKYGGKPVACVELKIKKSWRDLTEQLLATLNNSQIRFCFVVVNDEFKYFDPTSKQLIDSDEGTILSKLLHSVEEQAEICEDTIMNSLLEWIETQKQWGMIRDVISKYLLKGALKRCGNNVFFDNCTERELFHELLKNTDEELPKELCRYTSVKNFCLSLQNGFWLSSVEIMNDEFETKVIDDYPNLSSVLTELPNYIKHGFIISFSKVSRKDKLLQWYMYGDKAAGVCFTVKPTSNNTNDVIWEPVIYVPHKSETKGETILDVLNDLMGYKIDGKFWFKLRLWHYWKFFFKYDFYKEEEEVRLLIIQEKEGNTDWSEAFNKTYNYISKKIEELPFEITGIVLGPRCQNKKDFQRYLTTLLGDALDISPSKIIGYR